MKKSLCIWFMVILPTLVMGRKTINKNHTPAQIDNAWIRVTWSHG